ncbi:ABC transporter ATP-binding protein [Vagococcus acidifermentans]|uniref:ABC transporter ATP-binding protein n=1 Tax=Vagococcus acidifermentans TaxID=564710 RepID=A0A430AS57_9ENTE|nr:ABC transporter ATP-binding protein [Vagococcus acidifermentans]RSU10887.1 ABC transporter ATP-binding protein [Vagococcus acidifermentans]
MEILKTEQLSKHYGKEETLVKAVDNVSLTVSQGEFIAIVGRSGSGKSTLLHLIGGLETPTSGKLYVNGQDISQLSADELTIFRRRKIGFVFQQYNLLPLMTVYDNIVLPIQLDGGDVDEAYVNELLHLLGLTDKIHVLPGKLSGGQQQRVAIARALATKPAIVLADEPTGNLDSVTSLDVLGLMNATSRKYNQTVLMITHDEKIAQMANRIIRIEDGRIAGDAQ